MNLVIVVGLFDIGGFQLLGNPSLQLLLVAIAALLYFVNGRYVRLANIWELVFVVDRHDFKVNYVVVRLYVVLIFLVVVGLGIVLVVI